MLRSILIAASSVLLLGSTAAAQWSEEGIHVSDATGNQNYAIATADGAGGAFVIWQSYDGDSDIYMSRYDAWGMALWAAVPVCTTNGAQSFPAAIQDESGGVIVAWHDDRGGTYDIYAHHFDSGGNPLWATNGVAVGASANDQTNATIVPDGSGGAVIGWIDKRSDSDGDIYAQRVDFLGVMQWPNNGVSVCTDPNRQQLLEMDRAADGGAVFAWRDKRGVADHPYANRLDGDGNREWGSWGLQLSTNPGGQYAQQILHDGNNGAFIVWMDYISSVYDIYGQHVIYSGFEQWATPIGELICGAVNDQRDPMLCTDEAGGFIVAWVDQRNSQYDVYAQRVDRWANMLWSGNGIEVCVENGNQYDVDICENGEGGAVMVWRDLRYGTHDTYAQRVDFEGTTLWADDGNRMMTALSSSAPEQDADGAGGMFFVSVKPDANETGYYEPYLQRIDRYGYWGNPAPGITGADDVPGDEGGYVEVTWDASRLDPWPDEMITEYTVWRSLTGAAAMAMVDRGDARLIDSPETVGNKSVSVATTATLASKAIRVQQLAGATYYWEQVATVAANHLPAYACTAPTLYDTTGTTQDLHYWQVIANAMGSYWISAPMSGASADNLAPAAPPLLIASRTGNDAALEWEPVVASDLSHYAVYRSETSGFTPGPGTFLTTTPDTTLLDTDADPAKVLYYRVTALDVHDNESDASNEAFVQIVTGVPHHTPSLTQLTVLNNAPNPFGGSTVLRIGLPNNADVSVDVYDVAGRHVASRHHRDMGKGWRSVRFDGHDDNGQLLPSGVYFYRVRAAGEVVTMKMVIRR